MKPYNDPNDIKSLADKFFKGETSLDEERVLYGFFKNGSVPPELESLREMFRWYGDINGVEKAQSAPGDDAPDGEIIEESHL